jgi:hypothetical protein
MAEKSELDSPQVDQGKSRETSVLTDNERESNYEAAIGNVVRRRNYQERCI